MFTEEKILVELLNNGKDTKKWELVEYIPINVDKC